VASSTLPAPLRSSSQRRTLPLALLGFLTAQKSLHEIDKEYKETTHADDFEKKVGHVYAGLLANSSRSEPRA
jgi:hypothetical protein